MLSGELPLYFVQLPGFRIPEAYWGVPKEIEQQTLSYLDGQLRQVVDEFNQRFKARKRGRTG
jgi:hypothetical protein